MDSVADTIISVVSPECRLCHKQTTLFMQYGRYLKFINKTFTVQDIFPDWNADQRELLLTGTHPECWEKMWADADLGEDEVDQY